MKKLFYTLLIVLSVSFSFTSCTEEEVSPKDLTENGGANVIEPKQK